MVWSLITWHHELVTSRSYLGGVFGGLYEGSPVINFDHQAHLFLSFQNVVLFEENSILLLPESLESSGW